MPSKNTGMMMKFHDLLDNAKCYEQLRRLRWPSGVCCPRCGSQSVIKQGKQKTIKPLIKGTTVPRTLVFPDEYSIYSRLEEWGYSHKSVCHGKGENARDEGGDGFHEVHVNTMEGFWSLLRFWLRSHRGISQEKLPLYLGFFECLHNIKRRGKAAMSGSLELLLS